VTLIYEAAARFSQTWTKENIFLCTFFYFFYSDPSYIVHRILILHKMVIFTLPYIEKNPVMII